MHSKNTRRGIQAGLMAAVLAVGVGTGALTMAASTQPPAPGAVWTALAAKLGVPAATLMADVREVKLQEFQAFAAAHHLTAAQVKAGEQEIQSGHFAIVLLRHRWGRQVMPIVMSAAASSLKMSPSALREALMKGQTLTEIAQAQKVSPAAVSQAISTALTNRVNTAVTKGELNAEQAARLKGRIPTLVSRLMTWRFKVKEARQVQGS